MTSDDTTNRKSSDHFIYINIGIFLVAFGFVFIILEIIVSVNYGLFAELLFGSAFTLTMIYLYERHESRKL